MAQHDAPPRLPYATEGAVFCQHFLSSFPFTGNADVHEWRTSESVKILKECPVDCEVFGRCPYANDMAPMYKSVTAPREGGREGDRKKEKGRGRQERKERKERTKEKNKERLRETDRQKQRNKESKSEKERHTGRRG